jgi:hypothetical protein
MSSENYPAKIKILTPEEVSKRWEELGWNEEALPTRVVTPITKKASDLLIEGVIILDKELREWAQHRGMHLLYLCGTWHVMKGNITCTPGYDTPQKALEACRESGAYDEIKDEL